MNKVIRRADFATLLGALILFLSGCAQAGIGEEPTPASVEHVQIFMIALEDGGASGDDVGCRDSLVPVEVEVPTTEETLRGAYEALLGIDEQYYGQSGLYNALYQSDLQVESVSVEDGEATVQLSGELILGGTCDNPRVAAQLEETALQFPEISAVSVFINQIPLEEALSLRGS